MSSATFTTPFTVSNNTLTDPSLSVDNFYCNVTVQFSFQNGACGSLIPNCTGIGDHLEQITGESSEYKLYPNPTSHDFNASITLEQSSDISIEVFNLLGQKIARFDHKGTVGENTIPVNLQNCKPGIYFVKVKAGNSESTQKLIIE